MPDPEDRPAVEGDGKEKEAKDEDGDDKDGAETAKTASAADGGPSMHIEPAPKWDLDDDDLLPPPPEPARKKDFEDYRTGIEDVRQNILDARQKDLEFNKMMDRVNELEAKLEAEKEKETDVEKLQKRVLELERDLAEAAQEDDIVPNDRFWKRRNRNLQQLRDELKVEIELEKLRADKMAREIYMGEALDTKMAIRLKAIELDNQRLRRQLQVLLDQEHEHLKVKPIQEYLFSLAGMLNDHDKQMRIMQREVEALEVTYNYYEENPDKENKIDDLYCGRCRLKIVEESRGGEEPKLMSMRTGRGYGEPYYKGQGAVLGYEPPPAGQLSPPRGQFLMPSGGTTYGHYPNISKDIHTAPTPTTTRETPAQRMRAEAASAGRLPPPPAHGDPHAGYAPPPQSAARARAPPPQQPRYKPPAPKLVYTDRGTWEPV